MKRPFTIHHKALQFFENEDECLHQLQGNYPSIASIVYAGFVDEMPEEIAVSVAEIHPNFEGYYAAAMMPLFRTYSGIRTGTESAKLAIKSLLGASSLSKNKWVVIWNVFQS